jgi:hypothetical protein
MTLYYIMSTQPKAQAIAGPVNTVIGYPIHGVDIGGGIHCLPSQSDTTHYADVLQHPTLALWAYPADPIVVHIVGPNAVTLGLPAPAALDATWAGATVVGGASAMQSQVIP